MHIEFSPGDEPDCSIAMVVQSNDAPKLPDLTLELPAADSVAKRAGLLRDQITSAIAALSQDGVNPFQANLSDWCVRHLNLFVTAAEDYRRDIYARIFFAHV